LDTALLKITRTRRGGRKGSENFKTRKWETKDNLQGRNEQTVSSWTQGRKTTRRKKIHLSKKDYSPDSQEVSRGKRGEGPLRTVVQCTVGEE